MMMNNTLAQLRDLKLDGLADAFEEQLAQADCLTLSFEERLALLVDREVHARSDRKRLRLLKQAQLKYPQATIEDVSRPAAASSASADEPGAVALGRGWRDA